MPFLASVQGVLAFGKGVTGGTSPSSGTSILSTARALATTFQGQTVAPTSGGALTIDSQAVGNYDYAVSNGGTISSFTASDWFTNTQDTASAWVIVNGDLTINSGQTFIPSVRKLFTVLYITGNLTVNGTISMTARGANHSGTGTSGGLTNPVNIRIGTGTFSAIINPQIPATGGAGGAGRNTDGANSGVAGTSGGTGGGGAGYRFQGGTSGSGSSGTCFSSGTGGGAAYSVGTGGNGEANGGAGGQGVPTNSNIITGGTGNPGGNFGTAQAGGVGTAGTLIIIVEGQLTGTGSVISNGTSSTRIGGGAPGGASGGGSITILYGTNPSGPSILTATGGNGQTGGNGGAGTVRKLAIEAN
jgi:hypothetical protein